jgi:hypothetical protein
MYVIQNFSLSYSYLHVKRTKIFAFEDSVVGIWTGYGLFDRGVGVRVSVASRIFSASSRPAPRPTTPPIQWVPGTLSQGVKRHGRQADHSPPTSAEVKKSGSIHSLPHTRSWHSASYVRHKDNIIFFYPFRSSK